MTTACANESVPYYEEHAAKLFERYESVDFRTVHRAAMSLLSGMGRALDVGAGSGRDASALRKLGYDVTAVEPAGALLSLAMKAHPEPGIEWVQDELPDLATLSRDLPYDLILLSGVWMHIPPGDEHKAVAGLYELSAPSALVLVSFRDPPPDTPGVFRKSIESVRARFQGAGFALAQESASPDVFQRPDVLWAEHIFKKPMNRSDFSGNCFV